MRLNSDIVLDILTRQGSYVLFTKGMPADVNNDMLMKIQYLQSLVVRAFAKTIQRYICNELLVTSGDKNARRAQL